MAAPEEQRREEYSPNEPPWAELLRPDGGAHVSVQRLIARLLDCESVRSCLLVWHFLADFVFSRAAFPAVPAPPSAPLFGSTAPALLHAASALHSEVMGRARHFKGYEVYTEAAARTVWGGLVTENSEAMGGEAASAPDAKRCALLVHYVPPSAREGAAARPFVDLLGCFAERQGLHFRLDADASGLGIAWTGRIPAGFLRMDTYILRAADGVAGAGPAALNATFVARQLDEAEDAEALLHRLSREQVWRRLEASLDVVSGAPMRWAKVASISSALELHEAVIFFDYDVTVRPDCFGSVRFLNELFAPSRHGTRPSIVLRDSPAGVDCLNTGFVAFRSTAVARLFLRNWQAKMRWAGLTHGDQGAFAETLLELVHMEYRVLGLSRSGSGYNHECLHHLVPSVRGLQSWRAYCDCFQVHLESLAGGFGNRDTIHVRLVDPGRIDLNFVPNSLVPEHTGDLLRARLLGFPWDLRARPLLPAFPRTVSPLVVHWAGIPNRTALMRRYLLRRFRVPPGVLLPGRPAGARCAALLPLAPRRSDACGEGTRGLGTRIESVFQPAAYYPGGALEGIPLAALTRATGNRSGRGQSPAWRLCEDLVRGVGGEVAARTRTVLLLDSGDRAAAAVIPEPTSRRLEKRFRVVVRAEASDPLAAAAAVQRHAGAHIVFVAGARADYDAARAGVATALEAGVGPGGERPEFLVVAGYYVRAEARQLVLDLEDAALARARGPLGFEEAMLCEVLGRPAAGTSQPP